MRQGLIPLAAAVLVIGAMLHQGRTVEPVLCEAPSVVLGELPFYKSEERPMGEAERTVLPADTRFERRAYADQQGNWFLVTAVIGGRSKSSIHRPEMCLPAQGFQLSSPRTLTAGGVDWHSVTLTRGDRPCNGFAYTFFNQEGFRTPSHFVRIARDVWDRSMLGRIDRWVMVTVLASASDDRSLSLFLEKLKGVVAK